MSDVDIGELSDKENVSDESNDKISDFEFQSFSSPKIVKEKIMEIDKSI